MPTLISTPLRPSVAVSRRGIGWGPYVAGAGIGVLSWTVFFVADEPLGITTALSAAAGWAATPLLGADAVAHNSYWAQFPPSLSYGTLFLLGVILGGLGSAAASGGFRIEALPELWRRRFGPSRLRRFTAAFLAGALEMYGARLAGGCTSGHALSGGLQLALSSWVFALIIFAAAMGTARLLFPPGGGGRAEDQS
jgi:hypothetical protein